MKRPQGQWPPEINYRFENLLSEAQSIHDFLDTLRSPQDWRNAEAVILTRGTELCTLIQETTRAVLAHNAKFSNSRAPFHAEYVLHLLLAKHEREALIGDLLEEYKQLVHHFGKRYADVWFYKQVAFSIWPFVRRFLTRAATFLWLSRFIS